MLTFPLQLYINEPAGITGVGRYVQATDEFGNITTLNQAGESIENVKAGTITTLRANGVFDETNNKHNEVFVDYITIE